jgi:hypothetical protein
MGQGNAPLRLATFLAPDVLPSTGSWPTGSPTGRSARRPSANFRIPAAGDSTSPLVQVWGQR